MPQLNHAIFACPEFQQIWPKLRFSIEGYTTSSMLYCNSGNSQWPKSSLVSCETMEIFAGPGVHIELALMACSSLEKVKLTAVYSPIEPGFSWQTLAGRKFPPFKELVLETRNWPFTSLNAQLWDWSRITHLELKKVPIIPFLQTMTSNFRLLQSFKSDGLCEKEERIEASQLLIKLLNGIDGLENLVLTCLVRQRGIIAAIAKQGPSLRSLRLRGYCNMGKSRISTVALEDLNRIASSCPKLMELDLEMVRDTFPRI